MQTGRVIAGSLFEENESCIGPAQGLFFFHCQTLVHNSSALFKTELLKCLTPHVVYGGGMLKAGTGGFWLFPLTHLQLRVLIWVKFPEVPGAFPVC